MHTSRRSILRSIGVVAGGVGVGSTDLAERSRASRCTHRNLEPEHRDGTVEYWHTRTNEEAVALDHALDAFRRQYGHTVRPSQILDSNYYTKLYSALPDGDGPHLFEWAHDTAGTFADNELLTDMRDEARVEPCQYTDTAWSASQYDGELVGLPFGAETVALLYNEDIVGQPPETLSEMVDVMERYHDPSNGQYGLGFPIDPYYVSAFAQAYGVPIYDGRADRLGLASEEVQRGLRVVFDTLREYMPDDPDTLAQSRPFEDGNAAFHINGPWHLQGLDAAGIDYGVTTLPELPGGGKPSPYVGIYLLYFTSKAGQEPRNGTGAREYAEWFTTDQQVVQDYADSADVVPVLSALVEGSALSGPKREFASQVRDGYPMPANPKMNHVWGPFRNALENAFEDPSSLEDELESAAREIYDRWDSDTTLNPTVPGQQGRARNADADTLLEDVDGDGDLDADDVLAYYRNRESDAIRENPSHFDFDLDGVSGTVSDALELYAEID